MISAEEWVSGKNANPQLMSLKTGTRIRTYKPVKLLCHKNILRGQETIKPISLLDKLEFKFFLPVTNFCVMKIVLHFYILGKKDL
jgi:hypothetical protein